ncbi:hypothetical protein O181_032821 [Austropuccinia psidii MF-1]|uniref:Integrase zinc-binding domain-containing protein n=1 Tax=Austropuccinia psidii MF-1 TaxID=1389203 RepID=A0A9Q3H6H8_9BASI|nr:hypothetical protein [Austropuccinia psidii MF-1]
MNTILHECHDSIYSGHLSEDRTLEKLNNCAWWPNWRKETIEYCHTCDRSQNANRSTGRKLGLMIHIQEPKSPWEAVCMDWATELSSSGEKGYNSFLLSFSTAYQPQTDGLPERMIQTSVEMIRRFCSYGLEFQDSDAFTHYWFTIVPALEREYKTSVHSSTGQTPAMLEKDWNPRLPEDTLRKGFIGIHPTASSFKIILDKVKNHAKHSINDTFDYAKQKWDKSHKVPYFKVGDLALVSTLNFDNNKGPKKLEDSYVGPFVNVALHGTNAVQVELGGELENKHPTFPVNLIKPYEPDDKEFFL